MRRLLLRIGSDERGVVMAIAIALTAVLATVAITLTTAVQSENNRTRRDAKADNSYQAAEAGVNSYLAALTENPVFYNQFLVEGAQQRDAGGGEMSHAAQVEHDGVVPDDETAHVLADLVDIHGVNLAPDGHHRRQVPTVCPDVGAAAIDGAGN